MVFKFWVGGIERIDPACQFRQNSIAAASGEFTVGLDEIVLAHGGRIYLAKDARMSESVFKAGYPAWEKFLEIKTRVDPTGVFSSLQSKRIGLT